MLKARVDKNHKEIVQGLRAIGATVVSLAIVGKGTPDILVGYMGCNYLFEIKSGSGRLNKRQIEWHANWNGSVYTVYTLQEAIDILSID